MKTALTRRESEPAPYPTSPGLSTTSSPKVSFKQPALQRRRTNDDEKPYAGNAAKGSPKRSTYATINNHDVAIKEEGDEATGQLLIEKFIDGLRFNEMVTSLLKSILIPVTHRILRSNYVNTQNNDKLHLQSFGIGVLLTSFMVTIQPFLAIYVDGWVLVLGKVFKHLFGWLIVGGIISYVLGSKPDTKMNDNVSRNHDTEVRDNRFTALEYTVKNSRSSSPQKKPRRPAKISRRTSDVVYGIDGPIGPNSENMLMKMTEHAQVIERAKFDVDRSRPSENPNYDKFMDVALKKDHQGEMYKKFVNDNREIINTKTDALFG